MGKLAIIYYDRFQWLCYSLPEGSCHYFVASHFFTLRGAEVLYSYTIPKAVGLFLDLPLNLHG